MADHAATVRPGTPDSDCATAFGLRLKDLRLGCGYSLRRLGRLVHYSHGYVSELERGQKPPTAAVAAALDQALGAGGQLSALAAGDGLADAGGASGGLTPHASALHFFGAELRYRRRAAGLSTLQLAPRVLASPGLLDKVERAQRFPSADLAGRCDGELDADGALIRLHGLVVAEREADRSHARRAGPAHSDVARLAEVLQAALADFAAPVQREPADRLVKRIDLLLATAGTDSSPSLPKRRQR